MGNNISLGKNLRDFRRKKNLTQEDVCKELAENGFSCTLRTYRSWEKGVTPPKADTLEQLAQILCVDIDRLTGRIAEDTHDLQFICDYTGLSSQAIQKLHSFNDYRTKAFLSSLILEYNGDFHDIFADISTAIDLRTIQKNNGDTPSRKTEGDPNRLDPATLDSFMRALGRKTKNTPDNPDLAVINLKDALSLKLYNAEKCFRRFIDKYVDKEAMNDEM